MSKYIPEDPVDAHPFVTHYIEKIREEDGPEVAAAKLTAFKLEYLRFLGDASFKNLQLEVEEYRGKRKIKIPMSRAFDLIDHYVDLYQQEAAIAESTGRPKPTIEHRINWTGTHKEFQYLLSKLAERGLIDAADADNYAAVFEYHFLKKGREVSAATVRSAARQDVILKRDNQDRVDSAVDAIRDD